MTDTLVIFGLGPITESRFREAFATTATLTSKAAAALIGLDVDTLGEMTDLGVIRAVRRGRLRSYTERDLRAYLLEGPDAPERRRAKRNAGGPRANKVVPFSARRGAAR
jgi:hypothetical protein